MKKSNTLNFGLYNKSDIFIKCKVRLEMLMAIYGDNAKVYDLMQRSKCNG
jgi:hypothetical protein